MGVEGAAPLKKKNPTLVSDSPGFQLSAKRLRNCSKGSPRTIAASSASLLASSQRLSEFPLQKSQVHLRSPPRLRRELQVKS